jgi:hypothetical protein
MNAAESGHLVIATLHATNVEDALYRIINSAPLEAEEYIRHQLASTVSWIVMQKLVYMDKIGFRLPLLSIMRGTQQIKGLIREKKLYQIENAMHSGKAEGMFTQERYLKEFLETREKYHNPMVNFRPEKGEIGDDYYNSTVFDAGFDSRGKIKNQRNVFSGGKPQSGSKIKINDQGNLLDNENILTIDRPDPQYSIDESYDLSEIIAETNKNFENNK